MQQDAVRQAVSAAGSSIAAAASDWVRAVLVALGGEECVNRVRMRAILLLCYRYFVKDGSGAVLRQQRGVVRTNCMDNLDRTNVVQARCAWRAAGLG